LLIVLGLSISEVIIDNSSIGLKIRSRGKLVMRNMGQMSCLISNIVILCSISGNYNDGPAVCDLEYGDGYKKNKKYVEAC
jgi:hypothetical protein